MTEKDFQDIFGDDFAELAEAMNAAAAEEKAKEPKPVQDGIWYAHDTKDSNGHAISWYRFAAGGKTILWASADNDLEMSQDDMGGQLPGGATGHAITIWNADLSKSIPTKGIAIRVPHEDGTHIDGTTIRSFMGPRAARFLGEFYGV